MFFTFIFQNHFLEKIRYTMHMRPKCLMFFYFIYNVYYYYYYYSEKKCDA